MCCCLSSAGLQPPKCMIFWRKNYNTLKAGTNHTLTRSCLNWCCYCTSIGCCILLRLLPKMVLTHCATCTSDGFLAINYILYRCARTSLSLVVGIYVYTDLQLVLVEFLHIQCSTTLHTYCLQMWCHHPGHECYFGWWCLSSYNNQAFPNVHTHTIYTISTYAAQLAL